MSGVGREYNAVVARVDGIPRKSDPKQEWKRMLIHQIFRVYDFYDAILIGRRILTENDVPAAHRHLRPEIREARTQAKPFVRGRDEGADVEGNGRCRAVPDSLLDVLHAAADGEAVRQSASEVQLDGEILYFEAFARTLRLRNGSNIHIP